MGWGNSYHGHKQTYKCPKCNYTSRLGVAGDFDNKNSNRSMHCPTHRIKLEHTFLSSGKNK